ncbi:MAG: DEAD/DEAH box helicase [Chloroflexota bacterium]|jgi:ATP-dependent RNA helicase RhlE|nr:DEAD/DEAH box helicase [Anaerolineae bacterium]
MSFADLQLIDPLLRAVRAEGYAEPSPIQAQAIPHVLAGQDLLGCAQTGTGKTAAFALPILQRLAESRSQGARRLRALVLSPTRELASQIGASFETYGRFTGLRQITIYGGVNQNPQVERLQRGADILVATPGRLIDLLNQRHVHLDTLEVLVLDEADRMLDMGFIHDVRRIIAKLPARRQTLLFSATMPDEIRSLADSILTKPVFVAVTPAATTVDTIDQSVYFVEKGDKPALLEHLLRDATLDRVLVFTRTKHGANKVVRQLERARVSAEAIHGNKSQSARERALANFKDGATRVLVATDIAARGIDVDDISHVINYDLPNEPESYVHRIGRTARAGASGIAYSFCTADERAYLVDIERLIRLHIPRAAHHPFASEVPLPPPTDLQPRAKSAPRPKPRAEAFKTGGNRAAQPARPAGGSSGPSRRRTSRGGPYRSQQPKRREA